LAFHLLTLHITYSPTLIWSFNHSLTWTSECLLQMDLLHPRSQSFTHSLDSGQVGSKSSWKGHTRILVRTFGAHIGSM